MRPISKSSQCARYVLSGLLVTAVMAVMALTGCGSGSSGTKEVGLPTGSASLDQVRRGRYLVTTLGCSDCHSHGKDDPNDPTWLAGFLPGTPGQPFLIGPFTTYPANLTPDTATGIGSFTARGLFNALRYGLDPDETPDVLITSTTPGVGNFPATPHYLAPPMPWPAYRHLSDSDLWAVVAYLKHGIKAVSNAVPDSDGPPDFWASAYTSAQVGPYPLPDYPAHSEQFRP